MTITVRKGTALFTKISGKDEDGPTTTSLSFHFVSDFETV